MAKAIAAAKKKPAAKGTQAIHVTDGKTHVVGVKALRVMLSKDGSGWFAQGLEIDYAAGGDSVQETKKNFEVGLNLTISEHLKMHGNLDKFLKVASNEAWGEYFNAPSGSIKATYSTIQVTKVPLKTGSAKKKPLLASAFPFHKIEFLQPDMATA